MLCVFVWTRASVLTGEENRVFGRLQSLLSNPPLQVTDHLLLSSHAGAGDEVYRSGPDAYSAVLTESQIHHLRSSSYPMFKIASQKSWKTTIVTIKSNMFKGVYSRFKLNRQHFLFPPVPSGLQWDTYNARECGWLKNVKNSQDLYNMLYMILLWKLLTKLFCEVFTTSSPWHATPQTLKQL